MDETSFQEKMNHILDRIRELPGATAEVAKETDARRERVQSSMSDLQEALDYLRLSVKYLVFDLEATRRENAYLRRIIEQSNRQRSRGDEIKDANKDDVDGRGDEERPDFGANGWE